MTVYSMTGYAGAAADAGPAETALNVEARSVNGRFLDLSLRLPDELRNLEPALRELLTAALRRGKVELRITSPRDTADTWPQAGPEQLNRLALLQSAIQGWLPEARDLSVHEALYWCKGLTPLARLDERALEAARRCVEGLREARAREGERLVAMLRERIARLRELATQAAPLVPAVVQRQQERFLERWQDAIAAAQAATGVPAAALHERALAEAAAYALRIDVAEELNRLVAHLDEIERLLAAGGELGKRLDFLIQELHREANTLGSKSAALELTNVSVEMKVMIEQMREQVQNIE
jgi:uncharacterized protein YicC (UPF0701 family)